MKNTIFPDARDNSQERSRKRGTSRLFVLGALAASAAVCSRGHTRSPGGTAADGRSHNLLRRWADV